MELISELTHNMFKDASISFVVSTGQGDNLASGNPTKEMDNWKRICES